MKKLTALLILFSTLQCIAQGKSDNFQFQAGTSLSTTANYAITGTDTSLQSAATIAPYLRVMHKSGLGVDYTLNSLIVGRGKKIYMNTATAFFESYDKPVNLNFSYTHFFFNSQATTPYTPISNAFYGYVSYKKLWLAPALVANFGFGNDETNTTQSVANFAAGFTHNFSFVSKSGKEQNIAPSIFLNAGSNEYYSFLQSVHYITQNTGSKGFLKSSGHGRGIGRGNSGGGNTTTTPVSEAATSTFTVNNVELNLYSSFKFGQFEIVPDGSVFVPVTTNSQLAAYWQIKFGYNF